MPIDEIDCFPHNTRYDKVINVYADSNLEAIFLKLWVDYETNSDYLCKEISDIVSKLRAALNVLESRHITCISARILHENQKAKEYNLDWYLINVWRGKESCS